MGVGKGMVVNMDLKKNKNKNVLVETFLGATRMFLSTVGLLIVFGIMLGAINTASESNMYAALGWGGVLVTGFIGTPIHELSHYLMCLLFRAKVTKVSFFRPFEAQKDGTLGYVSFIPKEGFFSKIGNFFIGFAPLIIGTILLVVLYRFLVPKAYKALKDEKEMILSGDNLNINVVFRIIRDVIKSIVKIPFEEGKATLVKYIIFMVLMFSISSHMVLSSADLRGAIMGMIVVFIIFLILSLILELAHFDYSKILIKTIIVICALFSMAVIFSLISLAISYIIYMVFG